MAKHYHRRLTKWGSGYSLEIMCVVWVSGSKVMAAFFDLSWAMTALTFLSNKTSVAPYSVPSRETNSSTRPRSTSASNLSHGTSTGTESSIVGPPLVKRIVVNRFKKRCEKNRVVPIYRLLSIMVAAAIHAVLLTDRNLLFSTRPSEYQGRMAN